ncbi:MAG: DUF6929 family protein [Xanthobacteraceae bacterium]
MISLTKLRTLQVADGDDAALRHLSAASGLACLGSSIYVVADDELHLGVFPAAGDAPGRVLPLFAGALPVAKEARKARKPDLESIALLPPFGPYRNGALLALGSGSTPQRCRGVLLGVDGDGVIDAPPRIVDLSGLFGALDFPALNIEGATAGDGELRLLQRGNNSDPRNAILRYPLPTVLDALASGEAIGAPSAIAFADLGRVGGVPLCFTDGASLPGGGMVFTAIAEDTADAYNDGPCLGAAIGIVGVDGRVRRIEHLDRPCKIEGVDARMDGDIVRLLLVTDADDAGVAACLFSAVINL